MLFFVLSVSSIMDLVVYGTQCEREIDLLSLKNGQNVMYASNSGGPPFQLPISDTYSPNNFDYFPDLSQLTFQQAKVRVCNGKGEYFFKGKGFPRQAPVTVWSMYGDFFAGETANYPIFKYVSGAAPAAGITDGFTNGRLKDSDPNVIPVDANGKFDFTIKLDYNPLLPDQAPLVNNLEPITQSAYCDKKIEQEIQNKYCQYPYRDNANMLHIAYEYLREFNQATGEQIVDANGNAVVARSPLPIGGLAFAVHVDKLSHGMLAGVHRDTKCNVNSFGFNCGDHYGLAMFTSLQ